MSEWPNQGERFKRKEAMQRAERRWQIAGVAVFLLVLGGFGLVFLKQSVTMRRCLNQDDMAACDACAQYNLIDRNAMFCESRGNVLRYAAAERGGRNE